MLSAIILSHNDEARIRATIDSLSWCDELVLVDDYSTDSTVAIAKKKRVTVYRHKLSNNFAAQRNYALTKAHGDWILFIDSDEVVSQALADEIKKAVTIDCAGFYMKRQDYLFGKKLLYGETGRVLLLRLAKKDAGQWKRPVHEVWDVRGIVGTLTHPLDHFPHPNVAQFVDEINRYSTLNASHLHSQHIQVPWWHLIAYPVGKFFMDYVWYRGYKDGTPGAVVAIAMSMHSFLTRAKLWLLIHRHEST